jgi:hypothetical protein
MAFDINEFRCTWGDHAVRHRTLFTVVCRHCGLWETTRITTAAADALSAMVGRRPPKLFRFPAIKADTVWR